MTLDTGGRLQSTVTLVVPGDLETRTGGYGYDREIVAGLDALGWTVRVRQLDGTFPFPTAYARAHAVGELAALAAGTLVLADGLAFGAMAAEAEREASRLCLVALVHHPLALEHGLDPEVARALAGSERRALACTRGVVVTSEATAAALAPYDVGLDDIAVVVPGTKPAPVARGSAQGGQVAMLCVASLVERKGYDVLIGALAHLKHLSWHLTCVGSHRLQPRTAAALVNQVRACGLADRVTFVGELDEAGLDAAYDIADLFVLPTRYEGYGMAVAEAVARGLPVVSSYTGAIPELVGNDSGRLLQPGDVRGWTYSLGLLLSPDWDLRRQLAEGARRRRDQLPGWSDAARGMAAALTRFSAHDVLQR
ncbi:MAG: glycosyltransferase family 4 protein [Acidobacteria bacterium]|nr:glycosyltransferase family 4 protein [Acidobacteriota bacterium]